MLRVELGQAHIGLLSDPTQDLEIPHLLSMPRTRGRERTFVRFAGDTYPTAWQGEGRELSFALTARYGAHEHQQLQALLTLLEETAPAQPDSRLLLRTHIGLVPGLDTAVAVELDGPVNDVPGEMFTVDVSFTARVVQHSFFA